MQVIGHLSGISMGDSVNVMLVVRSRDTFCPKICVLVVLNRETGALAPGRYVEHNGFAKESR